MEDSKRFLGTGLKFPIQVDETTGRIKMISYEEDIAEAVEIIVLTGKGERVRNPEFGCSINSMIFESVNVYTLSEMERSIIEALDYWEPRITNVEVEIVESEISDGRLDIYISYVVRSTNDPYSLVFPYYINEGFVDPNEEV